MESFDNPPKTGGKGKLIRPIKEGGVVRERPTDPLKLAVN
jgi:hypothetical protein